MSTRPQIITCSNEMIPQADTYSCNVCFRVSQSVYCFNYLKVSSDGVASLAYLDCLHHAGVAQLSQYNVVIKLTRGLKNRNNINACCRDFCSHWLLYLPYSSLKVNLLHFHTLSKINKHKNTISHKYGAHACIIHVLLQHNHLHTNPPFLR